MPIPYWAGHYIGLPFCEHGRDSFGLDCWGLARMVLSEQFGVSVPSYTQNYSNTHDQTQLGPLISRESKKWQQVEMGKEQCGDVIVLRMRGQPMHVGLVLGDGSMLHIERHINSAMERYSSARWKNRIVAFFRYKGACVL